jgi:predicted transposase/invertase (TIGR01784 family)
MPEDELTIAVNMFRRRGNDKKKPRKKNDELLKGAFEENFPDFLRFVYPHVDKVVDFDRGIDFMDKELFAIIPVRDRKGDKRVADLLAKLYLRDGTEKWVMMNVEIEGGNDAHFAYRLYQYNYRIRDRYRVSVAAISVFTGDKKQVRPNEYKDTLLGTTVSFRYLTYHVFDHSAEVLLKNKNPFALIALACQKTLLEGKIPDKELGDERLTLAKVLLSHSFDHARIVSFILFIKNFIFIDSEEINRNFDQQIFELTKGEIDMGILETIKMQERREGKLEGKLEEKMEMARVMKKDKFPIEKIAQLTKLSIGEIKLL